MTNECQFNPDELAEMDHDEVFDKLKELRENYSAEAVDTAFMLGAAVGTGWEE